MNAAGRSDVSRLQAEWIQETRQGRFREPGYPALLISEEGPGGATVCHALLLLPVASPSPVCLWVTWGSPAKQPSETSGPSSWNASCLHLSSLFWEPLLMPVFVSPGRYHLLPLLFVWFLVWPHQPPACVGVVWGDFSTDGKRWWCSQGLWKRECLLCECHCLGSLLLLARPGLKGPEFHVKTATKGWFASLCRDCHEWAEEPGAGHLFLYPCDHSSEKKSIEDFLPWMLSPRVQNPFAVSSLTSCLVQSNCVKKVAVMRAAERPRLLWVPSVVEGITVYPGVHQAPQVIHAPKEWSL